MAVDPTADELLYDWFGEARRDPRAAAERQAFWFEADDERDRELAQRYGTLARNAADGALDRWAASPRGRLALILLLDQLPRNLHRGEPAAFAQDAAALRWCASGIGRGLDDPLSPIERAFFYMPLEHAEDLGVQEKSVAAYRELAAQYPGWPILADEFLPFAVQHRDIIARFGRFPHRNAILGRDSTPEEVAYLEQTDQRFGQQA